LDKSAWVDLKIQDLALMQFLPEVSVVKGSRFSSGVALEIAKFCKSVLQCFVTNLLVSIKCPSCAYGRTR
jgi:hypothetical protein